MMILHTSADPAGGVHFFNDFSIASKLGSTLENLCQTSAYFFKVLLSISFKAFFMLSWVDVSFCLFGVFFGCHVNFIFVRLLQKNVKRVC